MIRMDGKKMSKSKGNLVTPARYFDTVGADALRLFHLFAGPPGDDMDWTDQTENVIEGCGRFLDRVWRPHRSSPIRPLARRDRVAPRTWPIERATHRLIAKVSDDIERWSFNTAVAACMEFSNLLQRYPCGDRGAAPGDLRRRCGRPAVVARAAGAARRRRGMGAAPGKGPWCTPSLAVVRPRAGALGERDHGGPGQRQGARPDRGGARHHRGGGRAHRPGVERGGRCARRAPSRRRVVARPPRLVNIVI